MGNFGDATVLRTFGQVPEKLGTSFESALLAFPEKVTIWRTCVDGLDEPATRKARHECRAFLLSSSPNYGPS